MSGIAGPHTMAARLSIAALAALLAGCAGLPPGADFTRKESFRLDDPRLTSLGRQLAGAALEHDGASGFRIITSGAEGLLARIQMIDGAERTLDLQYFIFRGDASGRLVLDALRRAALRGVRVRVLVDDGDTVAGDQRVLALDGRAGVEVRIFNPFVYRGHANVLRAIEFMFNARRLNYRMHNKLLVVDDVAALVGGRNIGDPYFQLDPRAQLADDDMFVAGPVAGELAATFDMYWNNILAIPAAALATPPQLAAAPPPGQEDLSARIAGGEPYAGMVSGRLPLVWARARVACDSPEKKRVLMGARSGWLMNPVVLAAVGGARSELLVVTPYLIPTTEDMQVLRDLGRRQVHVGILTNSLEGSPGVFAQSGYLRQRLAILQAGIDLHEARSLLGDSRGSGQTPRMSRHGHYALHAKLYVFDRQQLLVGSMNFDSRSKRLNTELGLIIDSPALAAETAARYEEMVLPQNAYALTLQPRHAGGKPQIRWHTEEQGRSIDTFREPAQGWWQRWLARVLSLMPFESQQ